MSSPPRLVPNKHESAIDCKNTTGQPEDTNKNECYNSKRLLRVCGCGGRREILFLSISLLGHFIVSEEVT